MSQSCERTIIPFEPPTTHDSKYTAVLPPNRLFFYRRQALGLTQREVAKLANMILRVYQRLEMGETNMAHTITEHTLAVCSGLLLDPYVFIDVPPSADLASLRPIPPLTIPTLLRLAFVLAANRSTGM